MNNPFESIDARLANIEDLILNIKYQPQPPETNQLLTLPKVAKLLTLSKASIYRLVRERKIPFHKSGGRLYFFQDEVLDWVKNGKQ